MKHDKRLKKIEVSLTPLEAILLWLKDMLDSGHEKYLEKTVTDPKNERAVLLKRVGEAVRDNQNDPPLKPDLLEQAVREAQKQAYTLMVLVSDLHSLVASTCKAQHARVGLLMNTLFHMTMHLRNGGNVDRKAWDWCRTMLIDTLTSLWLTKKLVDSISQKYYGGHKLLFPEHEEALNSDISFLEETVKDYNRLEGHLPGWMLIDLDGQLSLVTEHVNATVSLYLESAQVKTLADFGEKDAARKLLDAGDHAILREIERVRSLVSQQESSTS